MRAAASDLVYLTGWTARYEHQFHVVHVRYETRDLPGSVKAMKEAFRLQPQQERQGRVHFPAVLAQRQYELGQGIEPAA